MPSRSTRVSTNTALRVAVHEPGAGRPCVHLLESPPPECVSFNAAAVARLNWQPVISGDLIASRVGDVLTLAFDYLGAIPPYGYRQHYPIGGRLDPTRQWRYQLYQEPGGIVRGERIDDDGEPSEPVPSSAVP